MANTLTGRRVTAADIAREVGVSRATVGFVLNATAGQTISPATRERVLEAAGRLGYRPHLAAQALASGRNHIVLLATTLGYRDPHLRRYLRTTVSRAGHDLVAGVRTVRDPKRRGVGAKVRGVLGGVRRAGLDLTGTVGGLVASVGATAQVRRMRRPVSA